MNSTGRFQAFAYEDMLPTAPALPHSSVTTPSDLRTSYQSHATVTSSRRASRMGTESPLTTTKGSRAASPSNKERSISATPRNGAASLNGTQHSPTEVASADAASPTNTRHSARSAASDQIASLTNTEHSPTATASSYPASSTERCPATSPVSASKALLQGQPNPKTSTSGKPITSEMWHLLNISAGDILTALIKCQVNLPTKEVILATGNPLGMMIPTQKKFVLQGGKIRHGRVVEGRVVQVPSAAFEIFMATVYEKAFANGVEELEYPLTKPLTRTRASGAPRPTVKEIRAAVAKEIKEAVENEVEGVVAKLVEGAVMSVVEELEREVEATVAELVEEALARSVERPILVKGLKLEDPFVA